VKIPFTWKVTGWFMIGWSGDFPRGEVRSLRYFGEDLVAYRTEAGELNVLDAHCLHLGAHLGHRGTVRGDCVACPYHGWEWGSDGENKHIPYEDRPNRSQRLRVWHVREQHECVFLWHQPHNEPPSWQLGDIFDSHPELSIDPADFYRAWPEMSARSDGEPVHPQAVAENAPDSEHFHYVHHATVHPVREHWDIEGPMLRFVAGWPDARSDDPNAMALRIYSDHNGLGVAISAFTGAQNHRLIFGCTPVDDEKSDMFYSIWWPREKGDDSPAPPDAVREQVWRDFMSTMEDDLEIWRYQDYVEHPAMAKGDAREYGALRKWARQFYDIEPGESVTIKT
jgi:phenylpropionate dioxygenase-like ring-hydroxylating dioxygenase large terminal subunit